MYRTNMNDVNLENIITFETRPQQILQLCENGVGYLSKIKSELINTVESFWQWKKCAKHFCPLIPASGKQAAQDECLGTLKTGLSTIQHENKGNMYVEWLCEFSPFRVQLHIPFYSRLRSQLQLVSFCQPYDERATGNTRFCLRKPLERNVKGEGAVHVRNVECLQMPVLTLILVYESSFTYPINADLRDILAKIRNIYI